jgi:hypothetical protein
VPEHTPTRTALITAGAYIGAELAAEFGRMPPVFLPVGNRRLFAHQHAALAGHFDRILLSLPDDFVLADFDRDHLEALGIEVVRVPFGLDLPGSILHVIADRELDGGQFAVLHGDTLMFGIDYGQPDTIAVSRADDAYNWAGCTIDDGMVTNVFNMSEAGMNEAPVVSGFFHFADLNLVVRSLAASRGNFINAVQRYLSKRRMTASTSDRWLDFGHVHTYYASRGRITTERAFNSLEVGRRLVAKRSTRGDRIDAEAGWYENVPAPLRIYLPHYIGRTASEAGQAYTLEFLYMASLADLFVFGRLPEPVWTRILASCADFLHAAAEFPAPAGTGTGVMELYLPKTIARLHEYAEASGVDLHRGWRINGVDTPGLLDIAERSSTWITQPKPRHLTIVHGDPCFSNILYDYRSHSVRVIDPRGQDASGRPTIWGDNRYDLAKLHHSIIGGYDLIIAGFCEAAVLGPHDLELVMPSGATFEGTQRAFERVIARPHAEDMQAVEAISLHLFLSMLPLHADSAIRQQTLLANALRLYVMITQREARG